MILIHEIVHETATVGMYISKFQKISERHIKQESDQKAPSLLAFTHFLITSEYFATQLGKLAFYR